MSTTRSTDADEADRSAERAAEKVGAVEQVRSVGELFFAAVDGFGSRPAMRHRCPTDGWVDISWPRYGDLVSRLGAALVSSLAVAQGDRVAILSASRWQWAVADLASLAIGAVTVPIYHSNLPPDVRYVLEHSGASVVFVEDREQLAKVIEIKAELPQLSRVVLIEGKAKDDGLTIGFDALLQAGALALEQDPQLLRGRLELLRRDALATIVYTSGTTGPPKGAMLTHDSLLFELDSLARTMAVSEGDETLLFLPLAHIFARVGYLTSLRLGYTVSYAESTERLLDNLAEVRPTFMFSVPRIYEKVYNRVVSQVQAGSRLKRQLFGYAMLLGRAVSRRQQAGRWVSPLLRLGFQAAELLVFNKLKRTFGGELRFFISGGAPLSREIAEFFHAAGILVLEAYGLTENTAGATLNTFDKFRLGSVGRALPGVEVCVADDGEILLRGRNVFCGYYRREDATREVLRDDGWFHTGDIGVLDADGFLTITDRKKDLIVTSGGKNVAPQNIENLLKTDPLISQVLVHGDRRNYLTALLTLDPDEIRRYAERKEIAYEDFAELTRHPLVRQKLTRVIEAKNRQLASYETIKKFAILEADFEVGEELTPTLKVKRKFTSDKYRAILDGLYSGEAPA